MGRSEAGWSTPLVIEAAICPYRPGQPVFDRDGMVAEAKTCFAAGAGIIHHHHDMRLDEGAATEEMVSMGRAVKAACPDALLYPDFLTGETVGDVTAHMVPMHEAGAIDLVPVDPGAGFSGQLDANGRPVGKNRIRFTFDDANEALELAIRLGHPVTVGVFEPFHLRWALAQRRAGNLPAGSMAKIYLAGDYSLIHIGKRALNFGLPPTEAAIDAYVSMLDGSDIPWCLGVVGEAILSTSVVRYAIERGGHVRVGIEDAAGRSNQTSAEMVRAVMEMARDIGRPVAQGDAARAALSFARAA